MVTLTLTVYFKDGREETVSGGTMLFRAWELYAMRHGFPVKFEEAPRVTALAVLAHKALGVAEGFELWVETVEGIEDSKAEPVPPTTAEPSTASILSSRSPSDGRPDPTPSHDSMIASSRP